MGVAKKKTTSKKTTKKATAAQLSALKKGREKLAKQRQADKKKVREALKSTAKKIKKRTSKIMTTAKKRATKAATSEIQKTRKKLRKKGLVGCSSKKKNEISYPLYTTEALKRENIYFKRIGELLGYLSSEPQSVWDVYNGNEILKCTRRNVTGIGKYIDYTRYYPNGATYSKTKPSRNELNDLKSKHYMHTNRKEISPYYFYDEYEIIKL